jgi:leucyl-tRNA synthetase
MTVIALELISNIQELTTCDPKYYKHTQRIFLLLHEHGLAYQAESMVNYDPVDKTVLANEQVDANGYSWRSGAKVEKKLLKQWFLRISAFRDALLEDLDLLARNGDWPEHVLSMQRNWLGKSKGARIKFQILAYDDTKHPAIEVFTTRSDTLFGVQYVALAATHPLVIEQSKKDAQLRSFLDNMPNLPQDSKDGFLLPNIRAINPLAFDPLTPDATKASLPIYVASYVLADYGDGAVMGVPGHDLRDNAFWKLNRSGDPIRMVVKQPTISEDLSNEDTYVHQGVLTSHSGRFAGKRSARAAQEIVELLKRNELGDFAETWRLRDWLISRQRYWGTPIPIIHCESCGPVPVPVDQLPVELPQVEGHWLRGKAGNPLEDAHDWVNTQCPNCHSPAKRDTDTMDTFVDSSWYFMRFADPQNAEMPFSPEAVNGLLPVDLYIGGVEHAILHLLYARFIYKFLATTPLWPAGDSNDICGEPFKQLLTQGMVHGKTYTDPSTGRFLKPEEVSLDTPSQPTIIATGETANVSFEKMSKSKYNGVDPTTCIEMYGADATRAHMLFQAPASEVLEWDEGKISGVTRWMTKLYDYICRNNTVTKLSLNESSKSYFTTKLPSISSVDQKELLIWDKEIDLWLSVQRTIISVTESFSTASTLNTVVSDLMTLSNTLLESEKACNEALRYHALFAVLRMMAPITPAFAEECWSILHESPASIFKQAFPTPDDTLEMLQQQRRSQACAVQINGKLKFAATIPLPPGDMTGNELSQWVTEKILETDEGRQRLNGGGNMDVSKAKKVIVVRGGKTVNFVL